MPVWDDSRFKAFDFETSGELPEYALQPWRVAQQKSWATSLVWCEKTPSNIEFGGGLEPTRDMMGDFLSDCVKRKQRVVGWNTVFDISWLLAYGLDDLVMQVKWLDGMLLWRHYFIEPEYEEKGPNRKSYGLKACVAEVLPQFAGYEEDVDFHDPSPAARKKLHEYNQRDTMFTLRCAKHWWEKLTQEQLRAALIEAECLPLVARANLRGMVVDRLAAKELQSDLRGTAGVRLAMLAPHGVTEKVVRSPKQLSALLFDQWKLPVLKENTSKKTGNVSRSTDKEVLHELSFIDPKAKLLREYREALNNEAKFADTPLRSAEYNGDGTTHPQAIVFGTYSGRLTYASKQGKNKDERQTGFALHQMKRGEEFRGIILAPEGYTIMEFDASGQEFRWMAIASGDQTMMQLCLPGEDAHSFMGARIANADYRQLMLDLSSKDDQIKKAAKDARQLGKVGNLSLQYRTSAKKLRVIARVQYNLPMELPEAQRIRTTYLRSYPGVEAYWDMQIRKTQRTGYVETYAGRRVHVVGNWNGGFGWSMGSTAINYRIQGTGADQKYLALAVLKDYLNSIGAYFAWDLHDGIYLYVPHHHVARAADEIRDILLNLPYKQAWGFDPPIPLPWDAKVGGSWGSLKEYEFEK